MTWSAADRVAAELEVRNLIARLAILADQGDLAEYGDQFTEDSVWALPGAPRHGRAEILEGAEARRAEGVTGPGTSTRHVITNITVHVDGPEAASAESYFLFLRDTSGSPSIVNTGVYRDRFRREGRTWRMERREITFG